MSTILFPFTRPNWIITDVLIIFNTNFCAVPDFIRVEPVTNSGPTITSTGYFAIAAIGESPLHTTHPVAIPLRSEEHTSELQSRENIVCRLLLEKKNTATKIL